MVLNVWKNFCPVLGGNACSNVICWLHRKSNGKGGLSLILKAAFGGVDKMLLGKNFPNNIRAQRMAVEEILRPVLLDFVLATFDDLMICMESLASKSCAAKLWLNGLVWPIFLAL